MNKIKRIMKIFLIAILTSLVVKCSPSSPQPTPVTPTPPVVTNEVDFWLTKGDQSVLLKKQSTILGFGTVYNIYPNIEVDDTQSFQTVDGFGYTLTGGSAEVINQLSAAKKQELLQELFGSSENSISVSYLRISIAASDLNSAHFLIMT
jgi:glucosylceramidase